MKMEIERINKLYNTIWYGFADSEVSQEAENAQKELFDILKPCLLGITKKFNEKYGYLFNQKWDEAFSITFLFAQKLLFGDRVLIINEYKNCDEIHCNENRKLFLQDKKIKQQAIKIRTEKTVKKLTSSSLFNIEIIDDSGNTSKTPNSPLNDELNNWLENKLIEGKKAKWDYEKYPNINKWVENKLWGTGNRKGSLQEYAEFKYKKEREAVKEEKKDENGCTITDSEGKPILTKNPKRIPLKSLNFSKTDRDGNSVTLAELIEDKTCDFRDMQEYEENSAKIERFLKKLKPRDREIVDLFRQGYSTKAIAERRDITERAVQKAFKRIKAARTQ